MNLSVDQFEKLLSVISTQQRRGSFATCKLSYNGVRDTETVESFLAATSVFKSVEQISDEDAIKSIPLILKEEAATWWNGVKKEVMGDFESRVRHAFAPKRPAYQLYQNIVGQNAKRKTGTFDALLKAARGVEQLLTEKKLPENGTSENATTSVKKKRCNFCRLPGHSIENCLKKQNKRL
ncbi:activity-regulated cytoskeleton associated protein 1-like [Manduca sexta]|uniref:activity-regulated cytoskeleton associated protein 1-like n=1 Tax=Manduca sexta TaxID=7130 RepID=UPI00189021F8|nr:activity-regulated cytoskeleton associated protein 1-like [Manduca sexta]